MVDTQQCIVPWDHITWEERGSLLEPDSSRLGGTVPASFRVRIWTQLLMRPFPDNKLWMTVFGTGFWVSSVLVRFMFFLPVSSFLFLFSPGQEATAIER